jgi:transposase
MAAKRPLLERALTVPLHADAKWLLTELLDGLQSVEQRIERLEARITEKLASYAADVELLRQIPCLGTVSIAAIVAETGVDMSIFASAKHLSSWAGLAPGKNESAGKNKSTRVMRGNPWVRTLLVQIAWIVSRTKGSPWRGTYARLVRTTGSAKKAALAVAHKLLVVVYHVLKSRTYRPFLSPPPSEADRERRVQRAVASLKELGFVVNLSAIAQPPPDAQSVDASTAQ